MKWLISSETLKAQTAMSLKDRSRHFLKEFPGAKMNSTLLGQIYRLHKIKKKKLRWYKSPKEYDPDKIRTQLTTMKREMTKARNAGYRFIYIDETMFTRKTVPDTEWSLVK